MKPTFETERLILRPARAGDVEHLLVLDEDPEVRRFVDQPEPPTREWSERLLARFAQFDVETPAIGYWMAEEKQQGGAPPRFVGWFQLRPPRAGEPQNPGDQELGYRLRRDAWGRGLATEGSRALIAHAFETLGAPRVTAFALWENRASVAVMQKLGLTHALDWTYRSKAGEPVPAVLYALDRGG